MSNELKCTDMCILPDSENHTSTSDSKDGKVEAEAEDNDDELVNENK